MVKYFLISIVTLSLLPMAVLATTAYNDVTFDQDTNLYVWGLDVTVVAETGSMVAGITVNSTNISLDLKSGSDITLTTAPARYLTNSVASTLYDSNSSSVHITSLTTQTVTVTPGDLCHVSDYIAGTGGGGSTPVPTVTMPATVTGEVTASAAGGGKTTLTTAEGAKATVEIPANTLTTDAVVKVVSAVPVTVAVTAPVPAGVSMVSAFNLSVTAAGASVSSLANPATLTFTYTDSQIAGLDESSLKVYHWNGTQWVALTGTINTVTNTITVAASSFSYFAIMGTSASTATSTTSTKPISQMTNAELQTEIARITTLIAQLQAQLSGSGLITGIPADFSFKVNLKYKQILSDVKYLQIALNLDPDTRVAATGAGSSGRETNYFGTATLNAVIKFQEKYASEILNPQGFSKGTGFVASATRAKLNKLLGK